MKQASYAMSQASLHTVYAVDPSLNSLPQRAGQRFPTPPTTSLHIEVHPGASIASHTMSQHKSYPKTYHYYHIWSILNHHIRL